MQWFRLMKPAPMAFTRKSARFFKRDFCIVLLLPYFIVTPANFSVIGESILARLDALHVAIGEDGLFSSKYAFYSTECLFFK